MPLAGIRVVSAVGRFGQMWGESIRPILVGRFGRESFLPMCVCVCVCVGGGGGFQHLLITQ